MICKKKNYVHKQLPVEKNDLVQNFWVSSTVPCEEDVLLSTLVMLSLESSAFNVTHHFASVLGAMWCKLELHANVG